MTTNTQPGSAAAAASDSQRLLPLANAPLEDEIQPLATEKPTCACGHEDDPDYPELDATVIPHAIRHATIFGALASVVPGSGLILAAPHDPLPLLSQVEGRWPGAFEIEYLQRGPEVWRLLFKR